MNNPFFILQTLDRHLDHSIELTLYGRAALALGFPAHEPRHETTQDDLLLNSFPAVLTLARLPNLKRSQIPELTPCQWAKAHPEARILRRR